MVEESGQAGATEIEVTPAMIEAGVERARELILEPDMGYAVNAIYMAMEYQRLADLGQLASLGNHPV